MLQSAPIDS
ncbi:23S rRNA (uracil-5-)-methyltransferase RumB, partial [Yersinia pestis PY-65]